VDSDALRAWIEAYERAWTSNDPAEIGALFTDDARYFTAPYREPWAGRDEIVTEWLARKDEPGDWTFRWEPLATDGDQHVVRGWTDYLDEPSYHNLWLIRLAPDGRCSEFTEWFMTDTDAEDEGQ
jgi:ketosteroid isomerase-like protein